MKREVILELYTERTRNYGDMHGNRGINGWSWRMGGLSIICDRRGEENNTAEGEQRAIPFIDLNHCNLADNKFRGPSLALSGRHQISGI